MLQDPFGDPFRTSRGPFPTDLFRRGGGGRARPARNAGTAPEPEAEPLSPEETTPAEEAKPSGKVILKNPKWEVEDVGFNEETDISVEAELPQALSHKTRVDFELFAKIPSGEDPEGGTESISKAQGDIKDGKAKAKIPVYMPQYRDADGNLLAKVTYYFTAKHSGSDLLEGKDAVKVVDHMADRLIQSHILEDVTFATGLSFLSPRNAPALKALSSRIGEWREAHPGGKLAVFGHADAVGQEEPNKKLSERRARSVQAWLVKDAATWKALHDEEKWSLATTQDLLRHLGHDPGASDGQDGPKTQAAVKAFQGKAGLLQSGKADEATREALYKTYMDEGNTLSLAAKDFDAIDGKPFMGCSEFNLREATQGACEKNRRVAVLLLKSNKNFPIQYPCKHGDLAPCRSQKGRKSQGGLRRTAGFGCRFYDDLVLESGGDGPSGEEGTLILSLGSPYAEGSLAVRKWALECAGQTLSGDVPADGRLKVQLPPGAKEATLRLDPEAEGGGLVWKLALAPIPPVEETKGLQIRLNNLGFVCGAEDGVLGKRTKVGIRTFQQRHGLPVTGEPDGATLAKVKELYGG